MHQEQKGLSGSKKKKKRQDKVLVDGGIIWPSHLANG